MPAHGRPGWADAASPPADERCGMGGRGGHALASLHVPVCGGGGQRRAVWPIGRAMLLVPQAPALGAAGGLGAPL